MRIGPYTLESELGRGGMGAVYRGRDATGRVAAVKVVTAAGDVEATLRFQREVVAVRRLEHPAIVPVLDAGVEHGRPWLAMPLVPGPSLAERLRTGGPLPWREAAGVVARVARAVAHAHARGVLHRDLKASNVLLGPDGPVLLDFGLARSVLPEGSLAGLTRTGQLAGTPGSMAPEQALGDARRVGPATDVYGLGALLFEALAGQPPFVGVSALEVLEAVVTTPPAAPSRAAPPGAAVGGAPPPALDALCLACLAKDPAARPASAEAVALSLERLAAGRGADVVSAGGRRRRSVLAGAALAAGLALVIAVVVASRRGPDAPPPGAQAPDADRGGGPRPAPGEASDTGGRGVEPADAPTSGPTPPAGEGGAATRPVDPLEGAAMDMAARDAADEALLAPLAAALERGELEGATRAVARALAREPEHPVLLAAEGFLTQVAARALPDGPVREARLARADDQLARALALAPDRLFVRVLRARAALHGGSGDDAARELAEATRLAPDAAATRVLGAEVAVRRGRPLEAWLALDADARDPSEHARAADLRAGIVALAAEDDPAAVVATLERAGAHEREDAAVRRMYLSCLARLDPRRALEALRADPLPAVRGAADVEALALACLGDAQAAVDRCPDALAPALAVADALLERGRTTAAAALCRRVLARARVAGGAPATAPGEALAVARLEARLARALRVSERREARAALARARRGAPEDPEVEFAEGSLHFLEDPRAPWAGTERVRRRITAPGASPDAAAWTLLAAVAWAAGRPAEADDCASRALAWLEGVPAAEVARASILESRAGTRLVRDDVEGALADFEATTSGAAAAPRLTTKLAAVRARYLALLGRLDAAGEALALVPTGEVPAALAIARATLALAEGDPARALALLEAERAAGREEDVTTTALRLLAEAEVEPAGLVARLAPTLDAAGVPPARAAEQAALARARLALGDLEGAAASVERALTEEPAQARVLSTAAAVAGARGDAEGARRFLRRLGARVGPGHLDARWALARLDAARHATPGLDEGDRALGRAVDSVALDGGADLDALDAELARVPVGRPGRAALAARLATGRGRADEAQARAAEALEEAPDDPRAHLLAASIAFARGAGPRVVRAHLARAAALPAADQVGLHSGLSALERLLGDRARGLAHAREAARLAPDDPRGWRDLVEASLAVDAPAREGAEELAHAAERLLALAPREHAAHLARGWLRLLQGDALGALADARRALELAPGDARARPLAARAWWHLGRPDLAARALGDVPPRAAGRAGAAWLPVWLALTRAQDAAALARAEALVGAGHPAGLRARALELAGRRADAVLAADDALALAGPAGDPDAEAVLARAGLRRGDPVGAIARVDRALMRAPEHPGLLLVRGLACAGLRRSLEAFSCLARAASAVDDPAWWEARLARRLIDQERPRGEAAGAPR